MEKCCDLDLNRTMHKVELLLDIFICYNIFEFQVPRLIIFIVLTDTQTHSQLDTHTHTHTHTHRHADDKPQLQIYYGRNIAPLYSVNMLKICGTK